MEPVIAGMCQLPRTATHCNIATHCNTLQHTTRKENERKGRKRGEEHMMEKKENRNQAGENGKRKEKKNATFH